MIIIFSNSLEMCFMCICRNYLRSISFDEWTMFKLLWMCNKVMKNPSNSSVEPSPVSALTCSFISIISLVLICFPSADFYWFDVHPSRNIQAIFVFCFVCSGFFTYGTSYKLFTRPLCCSILCRLNQFFFALCTTISPR